MSFNETYRTDPAPSFEGMVADMSNAVIVSRTGETDIGFGKALARGSSAHTARLTEAGDTEVLGISVRSQATNAEALNVYPANDTVTVMRTGPIWVEAGGAVGIGDPVSVTPATGAFVTGSGVAIPNATYETTGVAGELVKVHIL